MADRAEDFEIGPDGKLRRKDGGSKHPQLLGDLFRRDDDGSIRFDGSTPSQAKGSLLSNVRALVKSGIRFLGESPIASCEAAKANMSNDLRGQQYRKPVFESDLVRAAMGETVAPQALPPKEEAVSMLFPDGPKRGDGIAETSRAKARREQRTPWDNDATSAITSLTHEDSSAARERAQQASRTPVFDAGPDAPVAGID